eukprot:Tbor_TRINITY_DN5641_c7_g1::TRINITY_DN5641_c7_g1_i4::g.8730::m.8730
MTEIKCGTFEGRAPFSSPLMIRTPQSGSTESIFLTPLHTSIKRTPSYILVSDGSLHDEVTQLNEIKKSDSTNTWRKPLLRCISSNTEVSPTYTGDGSGTDSTVVARMSPSEAKQRVMDGYHFGGKGQTVCEGAFMLISELGSGAFSTVWLAIDARGVTSNICPSLMLRYRVNEKSYNETSAVMKAGATGAFTVLKISRSAVAFQRACKKEFETHQELFLRLQRNGFNLSKFLLFPMMLWEEGARGNHVVQVGDVCGPSLLEFVMNAAPCKIPNEAPNSPRAKKVVPLRNHIWRLCFIKKICWNFVSGLSQLHACEIIHTDVKPENILFCIPGYKILHKMMKRRREYQHHMEGGRSSKYQSSDFDDKDLLLAKHRFRIFCSETAWVNLKEDAARIKGDVYTTAQYNSTNTCDKELGEESAKVTPGPSHTHDPFATIESEDVVELLGGIKVADLGNSVFIQSVIAAAEEAAEEKRHDHEMMRGQLLPIPSETGLIERKHRILGNMTSSVVRDSHKSLSTTASLRNAAMCHAFQTREYRAPEVIVVLEPLTEMLTPSMDVWSVGCLIFELVTGNYLFNPRAALHHQQQFLSMTGQSSVSTSSRRTVAEQTEDRLDHIHLAMMQEICCTRDEHISHRPSDDVLCNSSISHLPDVPSQSSSFRGCDHMNTDNDKEQYSKHREEYNPSEIPDCIRIKGKDSIRLFSNVSLLAKSQRQLVGKELINSILRRRLFHNTDGEILTDGDFSEETSELLGKSHLEKEIEDLSVLLAAIFQWDPKRRPSMQMLLDFEWFKQIH